MYIIQLIRRHLIYFISTRWSNFKRLKFIQSVISNKACTVSSSINPFVMNYHKMSVLGILHIELNACNSRYICRSLKGHNSIFRISITATSMSPISKWAHINSLSPSNFSIIVIICHCFVSAASSKHFHLESHPYTLLSS